MSASPSATRPLIVALVTTLLAAGLSRLPNDLSATAVGLCFLAMSYVLVVRSDDAAFIRHYGLSLAGVFDSEPLSARRMGRELARAACWAIGLALILLPAFWLGFVWWWQIDRPFRAAPLPSLGDDVLGQLLVIALPEEAFYRGYLQTALDEVWEPKLSVLGARIGPGLFVSSAVFAVGHLLTEFNPNRLAVFFPALVFGWLRTRTRGIGAGVILHALCNLFASYLAQSYGFAR